MKYISLHLRMKTKRKYEPQFKQLTEKRPEKNSGSDGIWARTSQVLVGELLQLSYKAIQIPLRQRKNPFMIHGRRGFESRLGPNFLLIFFNLSPYGDLFFAWKPFSKKKKCSKWYIRRVRIFLWLHFISSENRKNLYKRPEWCAFHFCCAVETLAWMTNFGVGCRMVFIKM